MLPRQPPLLLSISLPKSFTVVNITLRLGCYSTIRLLFLLDMILFKMLLDKGYSNYILTGAQMRATNFLVA